jgi:hypothetical protein
METFYEVFSFFFMYYVFMTLFSYNITSMENAFINKSRTADSCTVYVYQQLFNN